MGLHGGGGVIALHGLWGVAAVADRDADTLKSMDEDLFAQAARVCVMRVDESFFAIPVHGQRFHAQALSSVDAEIARERDLLAAGEL